MPEIEGEKIYLDMPRKKLGIPVARRVLLPSLLEQTSAAIRKTQGERVFELANLGEWTDEELQPVIPVILPKTEIALKNNSVVGKSALTGTTHRLFPISSPALYVFNLINGTNTLEEICLGLTDRYGWPRAYSFAYVRGVFLALVVAGISGPKD